MLSIYVCVWQLNFFRSIFPAESTLGYREPRLMLQFYSLHLSSSASYPVSVYGIIAVRDELEPLRNHVFNHPRREDAVTIDQVINPGLFSFHITCLLLKNDRSTVRVG